ncbi:MAG: hypothetical protein WCH83_12045 [Alphaproteobacteria bacterium]|jgi:hypothetical protein
MLDAQARPIKSFDTVSSIRTVGNIVLSQLDEVQIPQLAELARDAIGPDIASTDVFKRVLEHNAECCWVVYKRPEDDPFSHRLIGFTAFLLLNQRGHAAVRRDAFIGKDPDTSMLCANDEPPSALYWWASVAQRSTAQTLPRVVRTLQGPRYRNLDIYTRPGTPHGARIIANLGFEPVLPGRTGAIGDLMVYRRMAALRLAS